MTTTGEPYFFFSFFMLLRGWNKYMEEGKPDYFNEAIPDELPPSLRLKAVPAVRF